MSSGALASISFQTVVQGGKDADGLSFDSSLPGMREEGRMTGEALNALREIGFRKTGRFHRQDGKLVLELEPAADDGPALYAFVLQGEVMYVGKTARKLKQRMYNYFNPGPTQPTNTRIRKLLGDALDFNDEVQIWGLIDDGLHRIGGSAAGLDSGAVVHRHHGFREG